MGWFSVNIGDASIDLEEWRFMMKWQFWLLVSTHSSSVNNYDAQEMIARFNESVCKAAEEAREEEMHKMIWGWYNGEAHSIV